MVSLDGNEKLTRAMCAAPKDKVKCPVNHINLVQCCTRSPVKGGQHQSSSKYCQTHKYLESDEDEVEVLSVQVPLKMITIRRTSPTATSPLIGPLPDNDNPDLLVTNFSIVQLE